MAFIRVNSLLRVCLARSREREAMPSHLIIDGRLAATFPDVIVLHLLRRAFSYSHGRDVALCACAAAGRSTRW